MRIKYTQQEENIALQTNFFTYSLHQRRSIFACINFRKYMGLDISCRFIFANEKDFTSIYTEKSGTIFWFCIACNLWKT